MKSDFIKSLERLENLIEVSNNPNRSDFNSVKYDLTYVWEKELELFLDFVKHRDFKLTNAYRIRISVLIINLVSLTYLSDLELVNEITMIANELWTDNKTL